MRLRLPAPRSLTPLPPHPLADSSGLTTAPGSPTGRLASPAHAQQCETQSSPRQVHSTTGLATYLPPPGPWATEKPRSPCFQQRPWRQHHQEATGATAPLWWFTCSPVPRETPPVRSREQTSPQATRLMKANTASTQRRQGPQVSTATPAMPRGRGGGGAFWVDQPGSTASSRTECHLTSENPAAIWEMLPCRSGPSASR